MLVTILSVMGASICMAASAGVAINIPRLRDPNISGYSLLLSMQLSHHSWVILSSAWSAGPTYL
jgi:hypothetical protein